ncbi:hypothetical protein T459_27629 [Capsicum annuum]|uniref:Uncharacterized protein n=1 Tax=Capsicum annuum TaxID=4072 RepID=A0A2G2YEF9_CAPAN|nr:hypothetical protein T459_27629 [Capsicum annuum]
MTLLSKTATFTDFSSMVENRVWRGFGNSVERMGNFVELARATVGKKGFGHMAARYILGTGVVEWNIKGFMVGSNGGEKYMELGCRLGLGIGDRGELVF